MEKPQLMQDFSGLVQSLRTLEAVPLRAPGTLENRDQIIAARGRIDAFLAPLPPQDRTDLLKSTLRQEMTEGLHLALDALTSDPVRTLFEGIGQMTPTELDQSLRDHPDMYKRWHELRKMIVDPLKATGAVYSASVDQYVHFEDFPYDDYLKEVPPEDELAQISTTIGHDRNNIPLFAYKLADMFGMYHEFDEPFTGFVNMLPSVAMPIYEGAVMKLDAYRQMLEGKNPLAPMDLGQVIRIAAAEAVFRAAEIAGTVVVDGQRIDGKFGPNSKTVEFASAIDESLIISGRAEFIELLFYQLLKNTIGEFYARNDGVKISKLEISAKKVTVEGDGKTHEAIGIVVSDNGRGFNLTEILRQKQMLLQHKKESADLTAKEEEIADSWEAGALSMAEIVNFIFERHVSGSGRHEPHSGIGLAVAKGILEEHGACVWATNNAGELGARFLLIFDPSKGGRLKEEFPELYSLDAGNNYPGKLLKKIDAAITAKG